MEGFGKLSNIIIFKYMDYTGYFYDKWGFLDFCVLILLLFGIMGAIWMKNQCLFEFIGNINLLSFTL